MVKYHYISLQKGDYHGKNYADRRRYRGTGNKL